LGPRPCQRSVALVVPPRGESGDLGGRKRAADVIALSLVAAQDREHVERRAVLDALGANLEAQVVPSSISEATIVLASRLCGTFMTRLLSIFISLNGI
jgi:hypothetical protein